MSRQWHRDRWHNALVTDERTNALRTRAVALAFMKYAGRGNTVKLGNRRLAQETGAARNTAAGGVRDLEQTGWLTLLQPASGTRAALHELTFAPGFDDELAAHGLSHYAGSSGSPTEPLAKPSGSPAEPLAAELVAQSSELVAQKDPASGSTVEPHQVINRDQVSARVPEPARAPTHAREDDDERDEPKPRDEAAQLVQELTGWTDPELLAAAKPLVDANDVRNPRSWLAMLHRNGDLERQLRRHAPKASGPALQDLSERFRNEPREQPADPAVIAQSRAAIRAAIASTTPNT